MPSESLAILHSQGYYYYKYIDVEDVSPDGFYDMSSTSATSVTIADYIPENYSETLDHKFSRLTMAWCRATINCSSFDDIVNDVHYKEIIEIGMPVLLLIFDDLKNTPKHWFYALSKITGENPIPESAAGNLTKMTNVWLRWARKAGLTD
jgi:hypothetical protein